MVLGYDYDKMKCKNRLCVLDCPNHCPIYGRAVVWAVIGDCPTGVPIGGALSAAQTTPLFVTEYVVGRPRSCVPSVGLFWGPDD